jgi:hypothetical protein
MSTIGCTAILANKVGLYIHYWMAFVYHPGGLVTSPLQSNLAKIVSGALTFKNRLAINSGSGSIYYIEKMAKKAANPVIYGFGLPYDSTGKTGLPLRHDGANLVIFIIDETRLSASCLY